LIAVIIYVNFNLEEKEVPIVLSIGKCWLRNKFATVKSSMSHSNNLPFGVLPYQLIYDQ